MLSLENYTERDSILLYGVSFFGSIINVGVTPLRCHFQHYFFIVFRLVRDVVANHKTTRYAGAATKVIQKNHLA